jgi:hypothetical protein
VCDDTGDAYGSCECTDAASVHEDAGSLPDGYAPIPPSMGDQGYNAIWASASDLNVGPGVSRVIYVPLFSAPDCRVVPPYGQSYIVAIRNAGADPSGTFPACSQTTSGTTPCYEPELLYSPAEMSFETVPGGSLSLSPFDSEEVASGLMNTTQGIVPLTVKDCP